MRKSRRVVVPLFVVIVSIFTLAACGKSWNCSQCDDDFRGDAYYDMTASDNRVMCEECAQKYWMPLDYKTYIVE